MLENKKQSLSLKIIYAVVLLLRPVLMIYSRLKIDGFLKNNLMEEMNAFMRKYNPIFSFLLNVFLACTVAFLIYDLFLIFNKHKFSGLTNFILYSNAILILTMLFLILVIPESVLNMPTIFDVCYLNILILPVLFILNLIVAKSKNS